MGNVAQNVRNVKELIQQVRLHPACKHLHDDGTYITVRSDSVRQYGYGFRKGEGRAWAYRNILNDLEQLA